MRRGRVESGRVAPQPRATGKSYSQCHCVTGKGRARRRGTLAVARAQSGVPFFNTPTRCPRARRHQAPPLRRNALVLRAAPRGRDQRACRPKPTYEHLWPVSAEHGIHWKRCADQEDADGAGGAGVATRAWRWIWCACEHVLQGHALRTLPTRMHSTHPCLLLHPAVSRSRPSRN